MHPQLHNQSFAEIKAQHGLTTLRTKGMSVGNGQVAWIAAAVGDGERYANGYGSTTEFAVRRAIAALDKMRRAAA